MRMLPRRSMGWRRRYKGRAKRYGEQPMRDGWLSPFARPTLSLPTSNRRAGKKLELSRCEPRRAIARVGAHTCGSVQRGQVQQLLLLAP